MVYTLTPKTEGLWIIPFTISFYEFKGLVSFQISDDLDKIIYISCLFIFDLGEEFFFLTFAPDSYLSPIQNSHP